LPFDLFVSRAKNFESIDRPRLFHGAEAITPGAFRSVMADGKPTPRPDGDLWLTHPHDSFPWFAARLTEKGTIVLSCSYTNHRFIRNFADAFDIGVRIAETLDASLFEEVRDGGSDLNSCISISTGLIHVLRSDPNHLGVHAPNSVGVVSTVAFWWLVFTAVGVAWERRPR
jgi:hypothetical protein